MSSNPLALTKVTAHPETKAKTLAQYAHHDGKGSGSWVPPPASPSMSYPNDTYVNGHKVLSHYPQSDQKWAAAPGRDVITTATDTVNEILNMQPARRKMQLTHEGHEDPGEHSPPHQPESSPSAQGDPKQPLDPHDWDDLEARFHASMDECNQVEEGIQQEYTEMLEVCLNSMPQFLCTKVQSSHNLG